jgi:ankyrin repeat protein
METVTGSESIIEKGELMMHNVNGKDRYGHTPLMEAAKSGDIEAARDLIRRGADLEAKSEKGKTALHYASANGQVEIVNLLLEQSAVVDARDRDWRTPLMLASIYGCNHTVLSLVNKGADVNAKTLVGNTAMIYAENNNHPLTLALLKKAQRAKEASV